MNPIVKNILAVIAGCMVGSVINMSLIMLSGSIIPAPDGADVTIMEGLKASTQFFEPKHFIMPFLAHALGTLAGSFMCVKIAAGNHFILAMVVGLLFFVGGLTNVLMLRSPLWFSVLDLGVAYFPMAYLGFKLAERR